MRLANWTQGSRIVRARLSRSGPSLPPPPRGGGSALRWDPRAGASDAGTRPESEAGGRQALRLSAARNFEEREERRLGRASLDCFNSIPQGRN